MKLAKSLLLGSAAGLMAVAGANAADLPVRAAAPAVDYVRVCNAYGTGFFFIPGTDTCLRVSGSVRVDIDTAQQRATPGFNSRTHNNFLIGGRSNLSFDSRTATEFGLLRTLTTMEMRHNAPARAVDLVNAYIQWGGFTAGRISSSAFEYYGVATYGGVRSSSSTYYSGANALWYTAAFGQGVSATIALEQNASRLIPVAAYGGQKFPEIIANLQVSQGWGGAKIAVAAHHINPVNASISQKWGWAALAGVNIKLPMLAPGSEMWLQGSYADGATHYTGNTGFATRRLGADGIGNFAVDPNNANRIATVKSWAVSAGLRHNWTPQWQSNLHGSFGELRNPSFVGTPGQRVTSWNVAANTIWRPVSGFQIGLEGVYSQKRLRNGVLVNNRLVRTDGIWSAKLRIQRDF